MSKPMFLYSYLATPKGRGEILNTTQIIYIKPKRTMAGDLLDIRLCYAQMDKRNDGNYLTCPGLWD